ncbi:MAG TPA: DUF222 domain-containing protein [Actinomycetes bacterium]
MRIWWEVLTGWEKLAAHVSASQATVLAELAARRPPVAGEPMGNVPGVSRFAGDEAALALGVSRVTGESRLRDAVLLAGSLPGVLEAARDGVLSWPAARAVAEEAVVLPPADRAVVAEFVQARCAGKTPGQVRRLARRAVLGVDPSGAAERQERAQAGRGVSRWDTPDGMTELCARLAPADAATVWDTLTGLARAGATPGDERGLDVRRADVLVDLFAEIATGTPVSALPALQVRTGRSGRAARKARRRARWRADVVVAASTLLGLDDAPGLVPGFGPVPAGVARSIARDATWRRVLTDPDCGAVLDVGTTRYRPSAVLGAHVAARDATCAFPGCVRAAVDCDLDHTRRFPDAPTADHNLGPLCGHHHKLKHEARPGWALAQPAPGTFTWTAPPAGTTPADPPTNREAPTGPLPRHRHHPTTKNRRSEPLPDRVGAACLSWAPRAMGEDERSDDRRHLEHLPHAPASRRGRPGDRGCSRGRLARARERRRLSRPAHEVGPVPDQQRP